MVELKSETTDSIELWADQFKTLLILSHMPYSMIENESKSITCVEFDHRNGQPDLDLIQVPAPGQSYAVQVPALILDVGIDDLFFQGFTDRIHLLKSIHPIHLLLGQHRIGRSTSQESGAEIALIRPYIRTVLQRLIQCLRVEFIVSIHMLETFQYTP